MLTVTNPTREPFRFRMDGSDTVYEIPYPQHLPVSFMKRIRALKGKEERETAIAMVALFTEVLDKYAPGATDELTDETMGEVMGHWGADGMGES